MEQPGRSPEDRRGRGAAFFAAAALVAIGCSSDSDRPRALGFYDTGDAGAPETKDPADLDGDGYTPATGDCFEGSALINPGAFEYVGNGFDDDCDGTVDNGYEDCDNAALDVGSAGDFARAMNICPAKFVVSAEYKAPAKASQRRIAANFGPSIPARFGSTLGVLSTGLTLLPGETGFVPTAPGTDLGIDYPRPAPYANKPSCPAASGDKVHDPSDLLLTLKAPTNAKAFSFEVRFFTAEYPQYYCSTYNDGFAAVMKSQKYSYKNIAYGSEGENLCVNVSFWSVCENITKYTGCKDPPSTIQGSGFGPDSGESHGATRWLTVTAPINAGEQFLLRLIVWDEGDGVLDSTVLLDNFRWDINPAEIESTVEQPK